MHHDVLTIETRRLVDAHLNRIALCPINSGSTMPANPRRGLSTFLSIADYPFDVHKKRNNKDPIVELTIEHSIPDIGDHTIAVHRMHGDAPTQTIWER